MRKLRLLFLLACLGSSCVKKIPIDPIPELEFKEFRRTSSAGNDSALFIFGYKDWDGDLFRQNSSDKPNVVIGSFVFNLDSNKFILIEPRFTYVITEPAQAYYRGSSIQGDIYIPVSEFRSKPSDKRVRFEIFMVDMKDNKSNVLSTPEYTFN